MRRSFLPYCAPAIAPDTIDAVAECLRNGWMTTGPATVAFEREFAAACGVPHAIALNSCTAGIHLGLLALGVGPGDEVIMPSMTFAAGAQCALETGARPVFCDIDPETFSVTPATIEAAITPRTKAVIAMPYGGRPLGIEALCRFARERGIKVLEDAAHGAGMLDRGRWPGVHSDLAVYSFYATKNLATGEGGMLVSNDESIVQRVRRLSLHGMSRDAWKRYQQGGDWRYDVVEPGFKYNLSDVASSIGRVQLRDLAAMQQRRDAIAQRYLTELAGIPGLAFQRSPDDPNDRHSWCMFVVAIDPAVAPMHRDQVIERLRDEQIGTSVHYIPTHTFTAYRDLAGVPLPNTENVAERLLSLPLYPGMTGEDVTDVVDALRAALVPNYARPILIA